MEINYQGKNLVLLVLIFWEQYAILTTVFLDSTMDYWIGNHLSDVFQPVESEFEVKNSEICRNHSPHRP